MKKCVLPSYQGLMLTKVYDFVVSVAPDDEASLCALVSSENQMYPRETMAAKSRTH